MLCVNKFSLLFVTIRHVQLLMLHVLSDLTSMTIAMMFSLKHTRSNGCRVILRPVLWALVIFHISSIYRTCLFEIAEIVAHILNSG